MSEVRTFRRTCRAAVAPARPGRTTKGPTPPVGRRRWPRADRVAARPPRRRSRSPREKQRPLWSGRNAASPFRPPPATKPPRTYASSAAGSNWSNGGLAAKLAMASLVGVERRPPPRRSFGHGIGLVGRGQNAGSENDRFVQPQGPERPRTARRGQGECGTSQGMPDAMDTSSCGEEIGARALLRRRPRCWTTTGWHRGGFADPVTTKVDGQAVKTMRSGTRPRAPRPAHKIRWHGRRGARWKWRRRDGQGRPGRGPPPARRRTTERTWVSSALRSSLNTFGVTEEDARVRGEVHRVIAHLARRTDRAAPC